MKWPTHRISGKPEWAAVSPADRNAWQRVAAQTHSIVTIGNIFSLLGLFSVPLGLVLFSAGNQWIAIFVLALGRFCDLLDGFFADKTGTKNPLGEKIDASFDKISTAIVLIGFVVLGLVHWAIVLLLVAPHIIIAVLAVVAFQRGRQFHPSLAGKFSMAAIWATILGFLILHPIEGRSEDVGKLLVMALWCVSVGLGLVALAGYVRELSVAGKVR